MTELPEPPAPPPPSSRFHAGRLVLGLVVVVIGVTGLLQAAGVTDVPWRSVLPGSLIAVGVGLVFAGRRSESGQGGLIAIGIVLTLLLTAASGVPVPVTGSARTVRARVGVGQLVVSLPADQLVAVHASMGQVSIFGQMDGGFDVRKDLVPKVPPGQSIAYSLDLSVGIGEVLVQYG